VNAAPAGSVGLIIKQARELGFKGRFIHIGQVDTSVVSGIAGKQNIGNYSGPSIVARPGAFSL
jgi:ABC-type branched-subunit amino acid transport system substrate-binding protein